MKKIFVLIVLLLCLVGCNDKKVSKHENREIVDKIDNNKDYVINKSYKEYILGIGDLYFSQYPEINLKSDEVDNLNLTFKNNILLNAKGFEIIDGKVNKGTIVNYKYYVSKNYISVIEESKTYFNGIYGSVKTKVYNIDIKYGVLVDNNELMKKYDFDEEEIFEELSESKIYDADYVLMYVRNNGYSLYVNDYNQLILLFEYVSDDGEVKKELVLED